MKSLALRSLLFAGCLSMVALFAIPAQAGPPGYHRNHRHHDHYDDHYHSHYRGDMNPNFPSYRMFAPQVYYPVPVYQQYYAPPTSSFYFQGRNFGFGVGGF